MSQCSRGGHKPCHRNSLRKRIFLPSIMLALVVLSRAGAFGPTSGAATL
ncbi:hypothetical protein HMPREF3198_00946 [Winkia neuii]|nr:hypothetical protein HMPREF3198_00946 [Winkia neuii]